MKKKKVVASKKIKVEEIVETPVEETFSKTIGQKKIVSVVDQGQDVIVTDIENTVYKLPKSEYKAL